MMSGKVLLTALVVVCAAALCDAGRTGYGRRSYTGGYSGGVFPRAEGCYRGDSCRSCAAEKNYIYQSEANVRECKHIYDPNLRNWWGLSGGYRQQCEMVTKNVTTTYCCPLCAEKPVPKIDANGKVTNFHCEPQCWTNKQCDKCDKIFVTNYNGDRACCKNCTQSALTTTYWRGRKQCLCNALIGDLKIPTRRNGPFTWY